MTTHPPRPARRARAAAVTPVATDPDHLEAPVRVTRCSRVRRTAVALASLGVVVTACAGSDTGDTGAVAGGAEPADEASAPTDDEGPTVIATAFGDVEVPDEPQRVVALGWGDAETALALGVEPVGASDWLAFGGDGVGPWAEGLYTSSPEIIGTLEPDFEQIASLSPDLILDVKGSGDEERHALLSEIAPTVGVPEGGEDYLTAWDDQVRMIAEALGHRDEGESIVAEVETEVAAVADAHPEWEGRTVTVATRTSDGWGAYVEEAGRVRFLQELGFEQSPTIAGIESSSTGFSVDLSAEQVELLEAELVLAFPIFVEPSEVTEDPLWQQLPAVREDRAVVLDGDVSSAFSLGTSLARLYALEELTSLLEQAVPAT
jgi:iron complex transport system substrate-binding protein